MTTVDSNVHRLDAGYKPFPAFVEWAASSSLDTGRWDRYRASLQERGRSSPDLLARARQVATRAAALDTGALEGLYEVDRGFTYSVALEAAAWETALDEKGEQVRALFEAQLHAYDFVLDLATRAEQFSEAAVRQLHVEICRAQPTYRVMTAIGPQEQELPKGWYKVLPNHVLTRDGLHHSYAPVDITPDEMARLMRELRSDAFLAAHPVMQAAYAHYGLVVIHPFSDGNGRVARALASAFTYRAASSPVVILSEYKGRYLDALEEADRGNYQAFNDFMLSRSLETLQLVEDTQRVDHAPTLAESLSALDRVYVTKGGFTEEQVDQAGIQLSHLLSDEVRRVLNQNKGPKLTGSVAILDGAFEGTKPAYRSIIGNGRRIAILLTSPAPAAASVEFEFTLWLPRDAGKEDDLLLHASDERFSLHTRMEDIEPIASGVLKLRVQLLAEQLFSELLAKLVAEAETIRRTGLNAS